MGEIMSIWAAGSWFIILVPLLGIIGIALGKHYFWQKRIAYQLGSRWLSNFSLKKAFIKGMVRFISLVFLSLAIARPQWGKKEEVVAQQGRDVLIALDISRSMLAQDVEPSRLAVAKEKIQKLITRLTAERVSLMVFSGIALIQCPFTSDTGAFMSFLDLADVEAISSGTTALDKAIDVGIKTFEDIPDRKQRIMIIFTDGEDFSADSGSTQRAQQAGLHIFTVGVGTEEGAPIPLYDYRGRQQGHVQHKGTTVISKLDERRLAELAEKTGGRYLRLSDTNDDDVTQLVNEIQRFEKEQFDDTTVSGQKEQYQLFAGLSLLALLIDWVL